MNDRTTRNANTALSTRRRRRGGLHPFGFGFGAWPEFDELFGRFVPELSDDRNFMPAIELREKPEAFVLRAELPGVKRDDFELKLEDDALVLRGSKEQSSTEEDGNVHRTERVYGSFERRIGLGSEIDAERAEARFADGVLTVTLPKKDPTEGSRTIPVLGDEASPA